MGSWKLEVERLGNNHKLDTSAKNKTVGCLRLCLIFEHARLSAHLIVRRLIFFGAWPPK
jgi:hypothetical protein